MNSQFPNTYSAAEINAAIARGATVTARGADVARSGQPARGVEVVVTEAFDRNDSRRIGVTARGYRGRFAADSVVIVEA